MSLKKVYDKLFKELGPQNWWPGDSEEEIIIGAILTQNTSWNNVEKAIRNLKKENLCDFGELNNVEIQKLAKLVYSTGYYNQKAKRLKRVASYFMKNPIIKFKSKPLADMRQDLLGINGVGNETADSILLYAFHKPMFVIDNYTKRVFYRLGYLSKNISYVKAQDYFTESLPQSQELFNEFHALIVKFAKLNCQRKPNCQKCFMAKWCKYKQSRR